MTREEEINKAADKYSDNRNNYTEWSDYWQELNDIEYVERAFKAGAKWADEHPKKGLVSIDKACKWFEEYLFEVVGLPDDWVRDSTNMLNGEERFRKAMEK